VLVREVDEKSSDLVLVFVQVVDGGSHFVRSHVSERHGEFGWAWRGHEAMVDRGRGEGVDHRRKRI